MAIILSAQNICNSLEKEIKAKSISGLCLASVVIGDDFSAKEYCLAQKRAAENLKIEYRSIKLEPTIAFEDFKLKIKELNEDSKITGIILNKPFPFGWRDEEVFFTLDEKKDVEGIHPINLGKFFAENCSVSYDKSKVLLSPTVLSIIELLDKAMERIECADYRGKKVTIVGFSSLIGRPLALWLGGRLATVSITHIGTKEEDLPKYVKNADIVISATGVPCLIKGDWIEKGTIVIDVGTGEKNGKITGDVEFYTAKEKAAVITPVLGGVGKLTTMFLFYNLVILAKRQKELK